jgi:hypothetical protein
MEDTQRKLETTISVTKDKISSERDAARNAVAACAVSMNLLVCVRVCVCVCV